MFHTVTLLQIHNVKLFTTHYKECSLHIFPFQNALILDKNYINTTITNKHIYIHANIYEFLKSSGLNMPLARRRIESLLAS